MRPVAQGLFHGVENFETGFLRLRERFAHHLDADAEDLDVHLQGGDAVARASDLEVHVAVVVFRTRDVREDGILAAVTDDEATTTAHSAITARLAPRLAGDAVHPPDVVQALSAGVDEAVAHQGQGEVARKDLGDCREHAGHGADREQRAGEEEGQDRHGGRGGHVILLLGDPAGQRLGNAVHEHGEQQSGRHEPGRPSRRDVERAASQGRQPDQDGDLEDGQPERDDQVSHHQVGARDGCGQQFALCPRVPVDYSTLSPAKMQLSGITRPTAPTPTNEV